MSRDAETLAEVRRLLGVSLTPAGPTFAEIWARYFREYARGLDTARDLERIGRELCACWGDRSASELTTADAEDYRDRRSQVITRLGRSVSPQTIDNELSAGRACLNWACDVKPPLVPHNGLARARMARPKNARKSKVRSEGELQRLLEQCSPLLEALVLMLIDCGPRRMEAIGAQWVQLAERGERAYLELWDTKNNERREIRLSLRTYAALLRLPRIGRFIFANPRTRRRYSPRWLARLFDRAVADSGLQGVDGERITFHVLRHSFAYLRRVRDKAPRQAIMRQGGWRDEKVFTRYGIPDSDEQDSMYEVVDANIAKELSRLRAGPKRTVPTRRETHADLHAGIFVKRAGKK